MDVCWRCKCDLIIFCFWFWEHLSINLHFLGNGTLANPYHWASYCFRPSLYIRLFHKETYAMQNGSSNTASSFHRASFSFVAFPWNNSHQIWKSKDETSSTDPTRTCCSSSMVTPGAVLISLVCRFKVDVDILKHHPQFRKIFLPREFNMQLFMVGPVMTSIVDQISCSLHF